MKQTLINRNEVFQGPCPRVFKVLKNFKPEHINFYIKGYYSSILIPKISKTFKIPEDQIIISYGAEDFLRVIFDQIDPQKDSVLTHHFHFNYYKKYLDFKGITLNTFKMNEGDKNFIFDIKDCIRQYKKFKPKIILLTSPNNPTGNSLSISELEKVLKNTNAKTLIVIDEAYYGFDKEYNQQAFLSLLNKYKNLILLRSFSKLYALAGLRIGFALCGTHVKNILKYQNHYLGLSRILEEVAIAALESDGYYKKISKEIIEDREYFIKKVNNLKNFKAFNSKANFVFVKMSDKITQATINALANQKTTIAKLIDKNFLRVTIGSKTNTKKFLRLLEKVDKQN